MAESLLSVTLRSLYVSLASSLMAFTAATALSFYVSNKPKKLVDVVTGVFESLVGVPTTVIGLLVYMLLYPGGPLGPLRILYTPYAIIIGEFFVALPVSFTLMIRHVCSAREYVRELVLSLGGTERGSAALLIKELAPVLLSSYLVAFSRAIGELGVALIVGGGIEGYTNVLTTAIAIQTAIGNYEYAIYLGLVLISITVVIALGLKALGERITWK